MSAARLMIEVLLIVTVSCLTGAEDKVNITAEPGQDVPLRCEAPEKDKPVGVLLWTRTDLDEECVYLYRNKNEDPEAQHPSYKNRVDLLDQQMKDGNMSLVLKNVMKEDRGTYHCEVVQSGKGMELIRTIYLEVVDQGNITAELGQDVPLRCEAPEKDKPVGVLLWTRSDLDEGHVYSYRDKQENPEAQHPSYKNRVDLHDKQMKDGELKGNMSLVLKNVMREDEGTYHCQVTYKGTDKKKRSHDHSRTIHLKVVGNGSSGGRVGLIVLPVLAVIIGIILIGGFLYLKKKKKTPPPPGSVPHDEAAGLNQPEPGPQV